MFFKVLEDPMMMSMYEPAKADPPKGLTPFCLRFFKIFLDAVFLNKKRNVNTIQPKALNKNINAQLF